MALPDIWLTPLEIAEMGLAGLPSSERGVRLLAERVGWNASALSRPRTGRGGGREYQIGLLPIEAQRRLMDEHRASEVSRKLAVIDAVEAARALQMSKGQAIREAALSAGVSVATVTRWVRAVEGVPVDQRAMVLSPAPEAVAAGMAGDAQDADRITALASGLARFEGLSDEQKQVAETRAAMLRAVNGLVRSGLALAEARVVFAQSWTAREDDFGLDEAAHGVVPQVSAPTLKRWAQEFKRGGLAGLAPKWGARKGKTGIDGDAEIKTLIEGMLLEHPDCSAKLVMRGLRARITGREVPSYRSVQRWIAQWKEDNAALYLMASSPDGFRSKARLVVGNASENVLRLNQRWEMDSTPNDVMLADGSRHALIGLIDVWSRRVRLVVARTSNAAGVAACLRKGLMDFGVPEQLKCDNGSDYKSRHMARVCAGLEIEQTFCQPFNPQEKPHIERFFRTFSHDLVTLLDGFIGHNVDQRSRIEDRKAFAARIMDKDAAPVELRKSAAELQQFCDEWCRTIYERELHSALGRAPFEQAQSWTGPVRGIEDERALDVLLMPAPGDGGTRVVGKKGIALDRWHYTDPVLIHHYRKRVQVRLDEADWGRVLVLTEAGEFICWALCPERMGVSRAEAAAHLRKDGREIEASYRKLIAEKKRESRAATIAADILGKAAQDAGQVLAFPTAKATDHTTPALEVGAVAAAAKGQPRLVEQRVDVTAAEVASLDEMRPAPRGDDNRSRFLRWERINGLVEAGETVPETDARFWRSYQATPDYAAMMDLIGEYGRAAMLGSEAAEGSAG